MYLLGSGLSNRVEILARQRRYLIEEHGKNGKESRHFSAVLNLLCVCIIFFKTENKITLQSSLVLVGQSDSISRLV